jgi:DNA polymerase-3 subunit beta
VKLIIDKAILVKALRIVGRAVHGRHTLPVLDNVLLRATDSLTLAGTDLEFAISCRVDARTAEPGAITLPAKLFSEVVDAMPDGEIELTLNPQNFAITVQGDRRKALVKGIDAELFPPLPMVESGTKLMLDPKTFREAINQTTIAAAKEDVRPALAGILCEFDGDKLTMVGADGYRMAVRMLPLPAYVPDDISIIVPASALRQLARLINNDIESIELVPSEKYIGCRLAQVDNDIRSINVILRLIDDRFPNYRQIMPTVQPTRVEANLDSLVSAVRLISVFSKDDEYRTYLEMGAETPVLIVQNKAGESGVSVAEVDAMLTGEPLGVTLNSRYLSDALGVIATERVALEARGRDGIVLIKPADRDDYVYAVMPMTPVTK